MAGYRQSFAHDRCAKRAAARIPAASSGEGPPALIAAAIGGGDGLDLPRCWDVEHDVHDIAQPANVKPGGQRAGRAYCWCVGLWVGSLSLLWHTFLQAPARLTCVYGP